MRPAPGTNVVPFQIRLRQTDQVEKPDDFALVTERIKQRVAARLRRRRT